MTRKEQAVVTPLWPKRDELIRGVTCVLAPQSPSTAAALEPMLTLAPLSHKYLTRGVSPVMASQHSKCSTAEAAPQRQHSRDSAAETA